MDALTHEQLVAVAALLYKSREQSLHGLFWRAAQEIGMTEAAACEAGMNLNDSTMMNEARKAVRGAKGE